MGLHQRRDLLEPGQLGGTPAPLAGDELVAAAGPRAHEHRLHDAALGDRAGERLQRLLVEPPARLGGVGRDELHRQLAQLGPAPSPSSAETDRIAARPRPIPR